jgi:HEAT repeat protein
VVQAFVEALRESGRPSDVIERWLSFVARHANPKVRALAADVAASRGGVLAERIGRRLVGDNTPVVRGAALRALGASRRRGALPELVSVLRDGGHEDQTEAATALGALGLPEAVAPLEAVLQRKRMLRLERGPVQHAAARALAALPNSAGAEVLRRLVGDRDPVVAEIAARFGES